MSRRQGGIIDYSVGPDAGTVVVEATRDGKTCGWTHPRFVKMNERP